MNKTVAIVGTHDRTRNSAPYQNNNIDIWVFNSMVVQDWIPRCSAVFDMHKIESFVLYEAKYNDWLEGKKDIPLYMQDHDDKYPNSVAFPFEEVVADLFPNFVRGEAEKPISYFTSSVCYALALAIHKGYERIEFYGIEMESNTEYIYQRDGIALFMGIAIARGIKVFIPRECSMFMAPLYGYDDNLHDISWETLDAFATGLIPLMDKAQNSLKTSRGRMDALQMEVADMMEKGISKEVINPAAKRYEDAVNEYDQKIADYAMLYGQYMSFRTLQLRVGKQMEASGEAQKVIAMTDMMKPR